MTALARRDVYTTISKISRFRTGQSGKKTLEADGKDFGDLRKALVDTGMIDIELVRTRHCVVTTETIVSISTYSLDVETVSANRIIVSGTIIAFAKEMLLPGKRLE